MKIDKRLAFADQNRGSSKTSTENVRVALGIGRENAPEDFMGPIYRVSAHPPRPPKPFPQNLGTVSTLIGTFHR
jgi:hypothetical protein